MTAWVGAVPPTGPRTRTPATRSFIFARFDQCPGCSRALRGTVVADLIVLVCAGCGAGWHVELGHVHRIDADKSARVPEARDSAS